MNDIAQRTAAGVAAALASEAEAATATEAAVAAATTAAAEAAAATSSVEPGSAAERFGDLAVMFRFFGSALLYELTDEQIGMLAASDFPMQGERPETFVGVQNIQSAPRRWYVSEMSSVIRLLR